jgi:uncharacterized membrane protein YphA (DoxX/SURF4 family)
MDTALWVIQIVLALMFGMAGVMKLSKSRADLQPRLPWVEDFSDGTVKLIGAVELLAAIGLVLPAATGILPWLTPLAAAGLAVVMVLAAITHLRRKEFQGVVVNAVLFSLSAFVAWQRFGPQAF